MTEPTATASSTKRRNLAIPSAVGVAALVLGVGAGYLMRGGEVSEHKAESSEMAELAGSLRSEIRELGAERESLETELAEVRSKLPDTASPNMKYGTPEGYPQIVELSSVPDYMRSALEVPSSTQAVAIAPGVWAKYAPGIAIEDAVNALSFDGFCASIDAYEREYLNGETASGSCW